MTIVTNPARVGATPPPARDPAGSGADSPGDRANTPPAERLYDNENQSDVVFLVGLGDDTWRYPAHKRVLGATGPVFKALVDTKDDVIVVDFVDKRGFEQLLRHHYNEPVIINSVVTARCTLDAAYKFLCPPLAERCAKRLDELLDAGVALEILRDLRFMCARLPGAASAPPLPALTSDTAARTLAMCTRWCDSLAHNALLVLDESADAALNDERLEELPYEDLSLLVKRETLRVSSELVLAESLYRWSVAACRRSKSELTPCNRRRALGELAYCPRYLLLRGEELERALSLELLDPVERALVAARAMRVAAPVSSEQEAMLRRFAQPRPAEPADLPVHLSPRSAPPPDEPATGLCGRAKRKKKKKKSPDFDPAAATQEKKRGCCACFGDGLLRALICLFD